MAIVNNAGADQVTFVGEFIDKATHVGDEQVWPTASNAVVMHLRTVPKFASTTAARGAFSESARKVFIAAAVTNNGLSAIDVDRASVRQLTNTDWALTGNWTLGEVVVTADGSKGYIGNRQPGQSGRTRIFDPATGIVSSKTLGGTGGGIVIAGGIIYCTYIGTGGTGTPPGMNIPHGLRTFDTATDASSGTSIFFGPQQDGAATGNPAESLAASTDDAIIYASSSIGKCVYFVDVASRTVVNTITDVTTGIGSDVAAGDGRRLFTCKGADIYELDGETGAGVAAYNAPGVTFTQLKTVNGPRARLYATGTDGIHVFDITGTPSLVTVIKPKAPATAFTGRVTPYDDGNWGVVAITGGTTNYDSYALLHLGDVPVSTYATADAAAEWEPMEGWESDPPLPPQDLPDEWLYDTPENAIGETPLTTPSNQLTPTPSFPERKK
jgi:hypothetical protein